MWMSLFNASPTFSFGRSQVHRLTTFPDYSYFEEDDEKVQQVKESYRSGELLTGDLKKMTIDLVQIYVKEFQVRRSKVTDKLMRHYMTPRKLKWVGNPKPKQRPKNVAPVEKEAAAAEKAEAE